MRTCPECHNQYEDEVLHCPEDGLNLADVEPVDDLIGRSVGSYRVEKQLGKGGMGAVYMGIHPVIGSRVAIKFLHAQYANDEKIVDRFFNEARAVNVIGHDNILKILDLNVTEDNRHYFVMEFLHGRPLQSFVKPGHPMTLEVGGPILLQVCEALQAAHNKGIFHRDLKPDNVYLITHKGRKNFVKVVDFGIAKLTDSAGISTGKTQTGMVMGTPAYMSPEQASGQTAKIDGRSDIYSLGVMMFQMFTGRLPFPGSNFGEVLIGHLQTPPPKPRSLNPKLPEQLEAIILKTLEKTQEARHQTMRQLHDDLLGCMQQLGISAELPLADDTEEMPPVRGTPSNPGARTPGPGRATAPRGPISRPPGPISNPRGPASRTGAQQRGPSSRPGTQPRGPSSRPHLGRSSPGVHDGATMAGDGGPQPKSKLPLMLGLAGGGIAIVVIAVVLLTRGEDKPAKAPVKPVAVAPVVEAPVEEKKPEAPQVVFLSIMSRPLADLVVATWEGGSRQGPAPLSIEVPKGTKVSVAFTRKGYLPGQMEIIADKAETVATDLVAEAPAPTATAKKKDKKDKKDVPTASDGLIELDEFK